MLLQSNKTSSAYLCVLVEMQFVKICRNSDRRIKKGGGRSPALQETLFQKEDSCEPGMAGCQVKSSPKKAGREQGPSCASWTWGSPITGGQAMETGILAQGAALGQAQNPFPILQLYNLTKKYVWFGYSNKYFVAFTTFGCHKKLPATFPQSGRYFFSWLETRSCDRSPKLSANMKVIFTW